MDKMAAKLQFDPEFLYCLMASPEWDLQEDALLPHAFQALSRSRQTMKLNLYAPCPEPEPQVPEPALDSKVKVLHPHRKISRATKAWTASPNLCPSGPAAGSGNFTRRIATGKPARHQRDTSAK